MEMRYIVKVCGRGEESRRGDSHLNLVLNEEER